MSLEGAFQLPGSLGLRFTAPADKTFLLDMFIAARPWLAESHPDADFVRDLYEDQLRINGIGQGQVYPDHLDFVVERTGQAIGHLVIQIGQEAWRIVQLEFHPLARGKGNGSDLVRGLQAGAERARVALTASALTEMARTLAFYQGLGFQVAGHRPLLTDLVWLPQLNSSLK